MFRHGIIPRRDGKGNRLVPSRIRRAMAPFTRISGIVTKDDAVLPAVDPRFSRRIGEGKVHHAAYPPYEPSWKCQRT